MCRRSRSASGLSPSRRRGRSRGHLDLPAFDLRQPLLEREPFRHLPHDLPGPVQVAFELRESDDLRREPAFPALLEDPVLVVDLVEADGDDVGADLVQDVVDVPLVAEDGAVDGLEGLHQLEPRILRRDRLMFEPTRRAVPRDDDPQLVAELPRLTQEIEVTGMEEIEDPRRHRRESRDRLRAVHVGHTREGVAMVHRDGERAVPIVLEVLRRHRLKDRIRRACATEHIGHERETDPGLDLAGHGHADQASRLLAEGSDPGRGDELARDREIRLGLAAVPVVYEDELPAAQTGQGVFEVHGSPTPSGVYQDYCKNYFAGTKSLETESLFRRRGWRPGCWKPAPSRPWIPEGCGTSSPRFRSNCRLG